jgi:hypothetical protein
MALKAIVDKLDGLPADVAKEYTKGEDGRFMLSVDAVDGLTLENTSNLRKAIQTERDAKGALEGQLKGFEGIDAKKAREALAKYEEIVNWTPDQKTKEMIAHRESELVKKHKSEIDELSARNNKLSAEMDQTIIGQTVREAIGKHTKMVDILLPHVVQRCRVDRKEGSSPVVFVVDDSGKPMISQKPGDTSPMQVSEFVETLKKNETFKPVFAIGGNSGGGTQSGGSGGGGGSVGSWRVEGGKILFPKSQLGDYLAHKAARDRAEKDKLTLELVD